MKKIIVNDRQTLRDISLQVYGTVEVVFEIALVNEISITESLLPGSTLILPAMVIPEPEIVNYYSNNRIVPVSQNQQQTQSKKTGIGFMTIGSDDPTKIFKVY